MWRSSMCSAKQTSMWRFLDSLGDVAQASPHNPGEEDPAPSHVAKVGGGCSRACAQAAIRTNPHVAVCWTQLRD